MYRRIWIVIFSGFFEPIFYLFSIGIGIGELVGDVTGPNGTPVDYTAFVAPALLAASAMNGAIFESTINIFFKLKYGKIYDAILSTPMKTTDIAIGEITWSLGRGLIYSAAFLLVMAVMGLIESWWGLLALPAAAADRVRLCRLRDGGHHLHEVVAGLRHGEPGGAAALPVLGDLLSAQRVPGLLPGA